MRSGSRGMLSRWWASTTGPAVCGFARLTMTRGWEPGRSGSGGFWWSGDPVRTAGPVWGAGRPGSGLRMPATGAEGPDGYSAPGERKRAVLGGWGAGREGRTGFGEAPYLPPSSPVCAQGGCPPDTPVRTTVSRTIATWHDGFLPSVGMARALRPRRSNSNAPGGLSRGRWLHGRYVNAPFLLVLLSGRKTLICHP